MLWIMHWSSACSLQIVDGTSPHKKLALAKDWMLKCSQTCHAGMIKYLSIPALKWLFATTTSSKITRRTKDPLVWLACRVPLNQCKLHEPSLALLNRRNGGGRICVITVAYPITSWHAARHGEESQFPQAQLREQPPPPTPLQLVYLGFYFSSHLHLMFKSSTQEMFPFR